MSSKKKQSGPRILILDIETFPLLSYHWGLWQQNISLGQIAKDWTIASWAARWEDDAPGKVMYKDQRNAKDVSNDKKLCEGIWKLLDEADVVITQNGKAFDHKKLNARFLFHGMKPPSTFKIIDTKLIAKKHFAFTSNKLEYMTNTFNKKYKKQKSGGFELWLRCMNGELAAWKQMEKYNIYDVLSLEELYKKLVPWESKIDFNVYHDDERIRCTCGSTSFTKNGYAYLASGKYVRYQCKVCGREVRSRHNLLSKDKRASLRAGTSRS
jgi:hypothetical protein